MTFHDFELQYLGSQPLGRLATVQPDGTLQVSPVGYAYNAELGTIDIGGYNMTSSRKYRNVADNGRVAFVVDDIRSRDPWRVRCLEIRGVAEAISDPPLIRLRPQRVISFGIDEPDTEAHSLTVSKRDVDPSDAA
jgi:pyridoxamine 5'-phosphate oxidase family protein